MYFEVTTPTTSPLGYVAAKFKVNPETLCISSFYTYEDGEWYSTSLKKAKEILRCPGSAMNSFVPNEVRKEKLDLELIPAYNIAEPTSE